MLDRRRLRVQLPPRLPAGRQPEHPRCHSCMGHFRSRRSRPGMAGGRHARRQPDRHPAAVQLSLLGNDLSVLAGAVIVGYDPRWDRVAATRPQRRVGEQLSSINGTQARETASSLRLRLVRCSALVHWCGVGAVSAALGGGPAGQRCEGAPADAVRGWDGQLLRAARAAGDSCRPRHGLTGVAGALARGACGCRVLARRHRPGRGDPRPPRSLRRSRLGRSPLRRSDLGRPSRSGRTPGRTVGNSVRR